MNTINLKEFSTLVATIGRSVTVIGQGEPGSGKSAMLPLIAAKFPTHTGVYVDAALLDLGDLQLPAPDLEAEVIRFLPNEMFSHSGPIVLMLDEIGKAPRSVQNALLPLLLEKRIGKHKLHPDSIVFGTTNLASDGVGDRVEAHARNRVCWVTISKPNADEWCEWALDHDVSPEVITWVSRYPQCLGSYTDPSQSDNPYIFNPAKPKPAFVTPRSLEKASHIVKQRMYLSHNALHAALEGTVGASAAADMQAFIQLADQLPEWARITKDPTTTPVPDSAIAQTILANMAVQRVERTSISPWMTYLARLHVEVQGLFISQVMASGKAGIAVTCKEFTDACRRNSFAF